MPYVEEVLLLLSVDHIWYYVEISVISLLLNKDVETQKKLELKLINKIKWKKVDGTFVY